LNIFAAFTDTGTATVRSTEGSSGTVSGTNYVTTNGYGYAWFASGTGSRITGANATISTSGSFAHAIYAISGGEIDVTGVQVETSGYGTPVPLWFCPYDAEKSGRGLPHSKALRAPATLV
jgi:hypothetical protein